LTPAIQVAFGALLNALWHGERAGLTGLTGLIAEMRHFAKAEKLRPGAARSRIRACHEVVQQLSAFLATAYGKVSFSLIYFSGRRLAALSFRGFLST
jgi:hypothetical protein